MFEDIVSRKSTDANLSALQPCGMEAVEDIRAIHPNVPDEYIEFISKVGVGEYGQAQYSLYQGLVEPEDIFGEEVPGMKNVVLFGDDMQGFCGGFDMGTWKVVEIDPSNMEVSCVAESFEDFIRSRLGL